LENSLDFRVQTNKTFWNTALIVHAKDGLTLNTNGKSEFNFDLLS
jgi:hypothetical protein